MKEIKQAFQEIREASRRNDDILGFVVTGSRGKGFANQWSDYDFAIFVKDEALEWELETYPLYRLKLSADELLDSLLQILETGDWRTQQRLLREAERVFTAAGYGDFFDWKMARFSLNYRGPT